MKRVFKFVSTKSDWIQMSTRSLLKAFAIVCSIAWAIYLGVQWYEWISYKSSIFNIPDFMVRQMSLNMAEEKISSGRTSLILQTIGALILFGIGLSIKDDEFKRENPQNKRVKFDGVADLANDAYKIFLVEKYAINKNEVLDGYILNGTIYKSLDAVLNEAHIIDSSQLSLVKREEVKKTFHNVEPIFKSEQSTFNFANLKKIALPSLVVFSMFFAANFIYTKYGESKRESFIANGMAGNISVFTDDESFHDLEAKNTYRELKQHFVFILGKISAYNDTFHSDLDGDLRQKINSILSKNSNSIKLFPANFKLGRKDGFNDVVEGTYQGNGVWVKTGVISLKEAKYNIDSFIDYHEHQLRTLLELKYDIVNDPKKAMAKLEEIAQQEVD